MTESCSYKFRDGKNELSDNEATNSLQGRGGGEWARRWKGAAAVSPMGRGKKIGWRDI